MNILIPHSWLKEYLDTKANPKKIAECLSLCGASVERINKVGSDWVYDIEITTNRVDMMSVLGIAREAAAILPQFGIAARLKNDPYKNVLSSKYQISNKNKKLQVKIKNPKLCPRFTAVIIKDVKIGPSSKLIQERLRKAGLRPINNIVDITNYLMKELGQPFHAFDWNEIKNQTMLLRPSKNGEKVTTLDGQTCKLADGDIVIEDGSGRLIDLCGIMGGLNSHVTGKTKDILLFVQTYDPIQIRKTSMLLGKRSDAAALFEKSPDPEMVLPAILKGIQLVTKYSHGKIDGHIIDIYPKPYKHKKVEVSLQLIKQYLGVDIKPKEVSKILGSLGFKTKLDAKRYVLSAEIPSWRAKDIDISEDLVEEVARIYGYHNLPAILPPLYQQPLKPDYDFSWEQKIKQMLSLWGLTEVLAYSMCSKIELDQTLLKTENHLKIKNPLTKDWVYLRTSLVPSLLKIIENNQNLKKEIKVFEMANVYYPQKSSLPKENHRLILAFTGNSFYQLKGICEALFEHLGIEIKFTQKEPRENFFEPQKTVILEHVKAKIGTLGQISSQISKNFEINSEVVVADLDFDLISKLATAKKVFQPLSKHPSIVEDLTFILEKKVFYTDIFHKIKKVSPIIKRVELKDHFKKNITFRIYYQDPKKNLTDKIAAKIRKKIVNQIRDLGWARLKGKITG